MRATRRTQPYRAGRPRQQGPTLLAMLRGKGAYMNHPADAKRKAAKRRRKRRRPLRVR